jgi:hypothetical protein
MPIEPMQAVEAVRSDVETVLGARLSMDVQNGGFALAEPATFTNELPIQDPDGRVSVVVWEWKGIDVGLFNDPERDEHRRRIAPSGAEVIVRGVTLVTETEDGPLLHRYVDWLDVFSQVGITVSPRPIVDVRKVWTDEQIRELDRLVAEEEEGAQA